MRRRAALQPSHESFGGAFGIPEYLLPIRRRDLQGKRENCELYVKSIWILLHFTKKCRKIQMDFFLYKQEW